MSEKATIFQTVQIGVESVAGTPVPAKKKMLALSIIPNVRVETDAFRAIGNKYASFVSANKEWTEARLEGKLTYNEVLYALISLLSQPTPVQQGETTAYKWTFTSNTSSEDAGKTLTVEQGDAVYAWCAAGTRVSGLTISFSREGVDLTGTALAEALETGITMTSSPTSLTPKPVLPAHVKLYMADSQSGLNSAQAMARGFSLEWRLTDKIGLIWPIGQDPAAVESEPSLEAELRLASDSVGMGLISTMRSGGTKWFRVKAEGDTIESSYKYTFQIDFPAQINDVRDFEDQDGIYLIGYTLTGIHDSTWGKAFQIDIINNMSTI